MKAIRIILCLVFAGYLAAAIAAPRAMYVDRYLLNYSSWYSWAAAQILPSMYTTEILITDPRGKVSSQPHHPARMFWILSRKSGCDAYTISVRYRTESAQRRYFLCDGRLRFDVRQ